MLTTNKQMYLDILKFSQQNEDEMGGVDWKIFFEGKSIYKKTYMQEIIQAVLEENDEQSSKQRVMIDYFQIPKYVYEVNQIETKDEKAEE